MSNYKRIGGRIDVNDGINRGLIIFNEEEKHGARSNKFWFNDYQWLYKDVDNLYSTYEDYAELISYEISKLLGMNCAEYDLATFNGRRGVISKSVVNKGEKIVSGTHLLNTVFDEYFVPKIDLFKKFKRLLLKYSINSFDDLINASDIRVKNKFFDELIVFYNQSCNSIDELIFDKSEIRMKALFEYCNNLPEIYEENFNQMKNGIIIANNLYDIWSAVEIYCKISGYKLKTSTFMKDLTDLFIFDIITSQGDRHADNWSVIIDNKTGELRLSGFYDNSGALALNRKKAIVNIDDFITRLVVEKNSNKKNGIFRQLKNIVDHSFSGLKVSSDDVLEKNKNDKLLNEFIEQSSDEFIERLKYCTNLLEDETNIKMIFDNIERKTGEIVPDIVKKVSSWVIKFNIDRINEIINTRNGRKL